MIENDCVEKGDPLFTAASSLLQTPLHAAANQPASQQAGLP
jgi:hypothetical protein